MPRKSSLLFQILTQPHVNAPHPLYLTLGGEALVKTFSAKLAGQLRPRPYITDKHAGRALVVPRLHQFAVPDKVAEYAEQRLESHVAREHEFFVIAPDRFHHFADGSEIVPNDRVGSIGAHLESLVKKLSVGLNYFVNLVKNFRLQDPFLLPAAAAQTVDPIAQWRVTFFVKQIDNLCGEFLFRRLPGNPLVKIE